MLDAASITGTAYAEMGLPWENACCVSFHARPGDKMSNGEIFHSVRKAVALIERRRKLHNTKRPHSALGYHPPAPETIAPDGPKAGHSPAFKLD